MATTLNPLQSIIADNNHFWSFFGNHPGLGISVISDDGVVLFHNRRIAELFEGSDSRSASGRLVWEVLGRKFADEFAIVRDRALVRGESFAIRRLWLGRRLLQTFWAGEGPTATGKVLLTTVQLHRGGDDSFSSLPIIDATFGDFGELDRLTVRELEVLALLRQGHSASHAAERLGISTKTVEAHRQAMGKKLQCRRASELIKLANEADLRPDDAHLERVEFRRRIA
jgi:DNA-binding CsgD family transcriptional regulator